MIIPKPYKTEINEGGFEINNKVAINPGANILSFNELNLFMDKAFGYTLEMADKGAIKFVIDNGGIELKDSYNLTVDDKSIEIKAADERGIFYGVQTLKQLIAANCGNVTALIPALKITDMPRFKHRGYMLDSCRHFTPVESIIKIIDLVAQLKLNVFHWHLTEDQGWRIQIDSFPELTTVGARRKETLGDGKRHGGYYSKEDIRKVVEYAKSKFITVIPEIDLPGHSMAAAAAYNYLTCRGESLEVATSFGIKPDIFCAGKESTYEFLFKVLDELCEMFPDEYIHLGGDEAPKVRWAECPHCNKVIKENGLKNEEQLQGYFINRLTEYLKAKGKKVICWNESIYSKILDPDVVCQYWSDGKGAENVVREINNGRKAIISKFTPYYLDYPFAMHPLKKVYELNPVLSNTEKAENIIGVEAPLWTEYIKNLERIEYLTFPRLSALAETAWTAENNRDYSDYYLRLDGYSKLLDIYGVNYAPKKELNPCVFGKIRQMLKFVKLIYSKESVKALKEGARAVREMKKIRKEV
ncbi:MAG: beta-N-acetylhexosaminidase [Christensenellales bacterium]|jgi:hexosaminidase